MKIAILGTGPAAMLAGYACERNGHSPTFYGRGSRSHVLEGTYLMRSLPDIHDGPDAFIEYNASGKPQVYADKVYGNPKLRTRWPELGVWPLWWLEPTYDMLYERYERDMLRVELEHQYVEDISDAYDLVLNTVPLPSICGNQKQHEFHAADVILVRTPSNLQQLPDTGHIMLYNGDVRIDWFKFTRVAGWDTWEYGTRIPATLRWAMENRTVSKGMKMLSNTCTCHPGVYRVGRWGQWLRGVLNHHPYEQAQAALVNSGLAKED